MKKLSAIGIFVLVFASISGTAFAQAQYLIDGANPLALTVDTGTCTTVTIAIDPGDVIDEPLISAGFWLVFDLLHGFVRDIAVYDGELLPALWDPVFTTELPPGETGTYFLSVHNADTVSLDDLRIADVELCFEGSGQSQIIISTIPAFDTVVGGTAVWDSQIADGIIDLWQVAPACSCDIFGPVVVPLSPYHTVTEQYVASPGQHCIHPPNYVWLDDCNLGDVDQSGLLIIPPTTGGETCTITVVDSANTDINTGEPVQCGIPIQLISPP